MMLTAILGWLRETFAEDHRTELERFLASKELHTPQDVEFWMAEFDARRRTINQHLANGDHNGAMFIRKYY